MFLKKFNSSCDNHMTDELGRWQFTQEGIRDEHEYNIGHIT